MKKKYRICFFIFNVFVVHFNLIAQSCPPISTYFGKSQFDEFKGLCKDNLGNIYAIGNTYNTDLPVTAGAFQPTYKANSESFIVKFDSCGALIWCTYFGTMGFDYAEKIVFSKDSSIVITGYTDGTDLDTTYNCFQPQNNGVNDCFVAKFNLNGQARWVTYFGGTDSDFSFAITIDKDENILIGGTSLSPTLYPTAQSFQPNLAGAVDAFLVKLNKHGQFKFSTFYGGTNAEDIHNIASDSDGNIIAVGGSFSNNLSTTPLCLQASSNGGMEIYVIKLDSVGNRLFSTYIGGSGLDDAYGVCVDNLKNIYLTGHTSSADFTTTAVSYQTTLAGMADNFCLKLTSSGALVWSTLFGGSAFDNNVGCKIDSNNEIVSLINTQSSDYPMLGTNNFTVHNGANDLVVAKISSSGVLNWSTYKGGSGNDLGTDLLLLNNKLIVCGSSASADFPVLPNNYQLVNNGQEDGFLSTIFANITMLNTALNQKQQSTCKPYWNNNMLSLNTACAPIKKVSVYDLLGRLVEEKTANNNTVDLSNLNNNQVYLVVAYDYSNAVVSTQKYLKTN